MAYAIRNLSVLAYAQGFTLWHYKGASETLAKIAIAGFFEDAGDMLASGDLVMITAIDGARIVCVASTEGSVVTAPLA